MWVEALTPKQVLLFSYLQHELPGYEFFLTTRDYDLNRELAGKLWKEYYVVGRHGGRTPRGKVAESLRRQASLLRLVESKNPDAHVTFVSPDSARVAYGVGIPVVACNDTPHSTIVSRLVIPLAEVLVVPQPVAAYFEDYARLTRISPFRGVFEVAWVARTQPDERVPRSLGLEPLNYVIVRTGEEKAFYYKEPRAALEVPLRMTRYILRKTDMKVLLYPRYPEQKTALAKGLSGYEGRLVFLERAEVLVHLEFFARLVITGGGTIATESALLGTPAITTFPGRVEVHEYLRANGFPVYSGVTLENLPRILRADQSIEGKMKVKAKASKLFQDPVRHIAKELQSILTEKMKT